MHDCKVAFEMSIAVADPGFELRGHNFLNVGGVSGGGVENYK